MERACLSSKAHRRAGEAIATEQQNRHGQCHFPEMTPNLRLFQLQGRDQN